VTPVLDKPGDQFRGRQELRQGGSRGSFRIARHALVRNNAASIDTGRRRWTAPRADEIRCKGVISCFERLV
jgi:hypothetical protein